MGFAITAVPAHVCALRGKKIIIGKQYGRSKTLLDAFYVSDIPNVRVDELKQTVVLLETDQNLFPDLTSAVFLKLCNMD